jgi:hypothetical protein
MHLQIILLCLISVCLMKSSMSFTLLESHNSTAPVALVTGIPFTATNMSGANEYAYYKYTLTDPSADLVISLTGALCNI